MNRPCKIWGNFTFNRSGIAPLFALYAIVLSVNFADAWLRVKRGSGGLGAIPPTSKPPPRYREALLAKMKNSVATERAYRPF